MRHTGGLGDNRKAAFEEILQRFEWRFPNHEWAAPKGHVEAVRDILGSEWYRKYFEYGDPSSRGTVLTDAS
jgi:predicted esterase